MKKQLYSVRSPYKSALSLVVSVFFLAYGTFYFSRRKWIETAVFLIIGIVFLIVFCHYISYVKVTAETISERLFGIPKKTFNWSEVHEIGIFGSRVFNRDNPKKTGTLYLYFSKRELSEEDIFNLAIKRTPKDIIKMRFDRQQFESIQFLWSNPINLYNVGDLDL